MSKSRAIPWPAIGLALAAGVFMLAAGTDFWIALAVVAIWIGSAFVLTPAPQANAPRTEGMQLTRDGMRELIEHSGMPLLLLDGSRIVIANAEAREVLGRHILGQDARVAFRHPAASMKTPAASANPIAGQGIARLLLIGRKR